MNATSQYPFNQTGNRPTKDTHFFLLSTSTLFAFFIFSQSVVIAQTDSLKAQLAHTSNDSTRVDLLISIGYQYIYDNPDSIKLYASKAIALAKKINYKKGEALAWLRYGQSFHASSNFATALDYFEHAAHLADSLHNNDILARCTGNLANLYGDMNYIEMAMFYNRRAMTLYDQLGNAEWSMTTRINMASTFFKTNALDSAARYLFQCKINKTYPYANLLLVLNTAELRISQHNWIQADSLLEILPHYFNQVANVEMFEAYFEYLEARYYLGTKDFKKAIEFAKLSIAKYAAIGNKEDIISVYDVLGKLYEETGDYKNALTYYKASNIFRDSIFSKTVKEKFEFWSNEREERKRAKEEHVKQLDLSKKEWNNKFLLATSGFLLVTLIGLTFAIRQKLKHVKILKIQKQAIDKQNKELQHSEEELKSINEELIQSQEEVMAQRDTLFHQKEELSKANEIIKIQNLHIQERNLTLEEEVLKRTREILDYNQQLEQYAFVTAHNLRAPVARILGLTNIFRATTDKSEELIIKDKLTKASVEIDEVIREMNQILHIKNDSDLTFSYVNLSGIMEVVKGTLDQEILKYNVVIDTGELNVENIYAIPEYMISIVMALIGNAIKFRNPDVVPHIWIRSKKIQNGTLLEIEDNGLGIDLEKHKTKLFSLYQKFHLHKEGKGMGLFIVKTQLDKMGAGVEVDSTPMKGTLFKLYFSDPS